MHVLPSPAARSAFPYDYSRIESLVSSYVPQWRAMGFDAAVAIARGGLVPALMASTELSVPLHALSYSRTDRCASWFTTSKPPARAKILLVEDIAGRGRTLSDCVEFMRNLDYDLYVFTLAPAADSRIQPAFCLDIPAGIRAWFPWARRAITPAFDTTHNVPRSASSANSHNA